MSRTTEAAKLNKTNKRRERGRLARIHKKYSPGSTANILHVKLSWQHAGQYSVWKGGILYLVVEYFSEATPLVVLCLYCRLLRAFFTPSGYGSFCFLL